MVQNITKQIKNVLQARETKWNAQQNMLMKARIQAKFEKFNKQMGYSTKLLENYKSWGDPCVSAGELQTNLLDKPKIQDRIVKADLTYFPQTHKPDMIAGQIYLNFRKYQMKSGFKT